MYKNIGAKIKTLAKVLCWIGIGVSVIYAIVLFAEGEESLGLIGVAVLFVGPLLSWVSSFILYGFGELIETNCQIAAGMKNNNGSFSSDTSAPRENAETPNDGTHSWRGKCESCGKSNVLVTCVKRHNENGDRFVCICEDCSKANQVSDDRKKQLDELLNSGLISKSEYDEKMDGQ